MTGDPLAPVREAAQLRKAAKESSAEIDARWRDAVLKAAADGVKRTELARAAGISRERLYQILGEQS